MRRDEIWNAVTLKVRAIYHGTEYEVIGYSYKHLTNVRESIILKDLRSNSVIECPIGDVQIVATAQKNGGYRE